MLGTEAMNSESSPGMSRASLSGCGRMQVAVIRRMGRGSRGGTAREASTTVAPVVVAAKRLRSEVRPGCVSNQKPQGNSQRRPVPTSRTTMRSMSHRWWPSPTGTMCFTLIWDRFVSDSGVQTLSFFTSPLSNSVPSSTSSDTLSPSSPTSSNSTSAVDDAPRAVEVYTLRS